MQSVREFRARYFNGFIALLIAFALIGGGVFLFVELGGADHMRPDQFVAPVAMIALFFISLGGFFVVQPNEAKALVFFGKYVGTIREAGFFWANPLATKQAVSLR